MTAQSKTARSAKPFTVTVNLATPRIVVSQQVAESNGSRPKSPSQRVIALEGRRAAQHMSLAMDLLHGAGADLARLSDRQGGRVNLTEHQGARLALTLASVAPVRKPSRASLIRAGIAEMSTEEVYYWYARMSPALRRSGANNALKALRILLSGG